ncbi:replicative DNA helicase [Pantoea ananatis]|uniref:replicative DNA helicase n=1 Tax=Pantoea ananas TaxID=553 RepID=UPI000DA69F22|nr:replicative DNA helicase [Pantoea ananatis]PZD63579.1 replicative DNA helicase [Pantoea ananatis]
MSDLYLEASVLGCLLHSGLTPDAYDVLATVESAAFTHPFYSKLYAEIKRQATQKKMIDALLVAEAMGSENGIFADVMETMKMVPSAANMKGYAKSLNEKYMVRGFISLMESHYEKITSAYNHDTAMEGIQDFTRQLMNISRPDEEVLPIRASELLDGYMDTLEKRVAGDEESNTIKTGIDDLDEITGGLNDTDLIVIAARPGMGKTELALKIAEGIAQRTVSLGTERVQRGVLIFSMEMQAGQIIERQLANASNVSVSKLRKASHLDDEDWGRISMGLADLANLDVWVVDATNLSIEQIRAVATRHKNRYPGLSLILADYLGLIKKPSAERNDLAIGEITRGLKTMAMELNTPVICLSQLSREVEKRPNKRPLNADLRDSGSIEQDADGIWFIYRDGAYNPDSPAAHLAEIIIGKNRHGPQGGVVYQEFRNGHFRGTDQAIAAQLARERPAQARRDKSSRNGNEPTGRLF